MFLSQIIAQTSTPSAPSGEVHQIVNSINTLGSLDPMTILIAAVTIAIGFVLLVLVYEWRRIQADADVRDVLQKMAKEEADKREKAEREDETRRNRLEDELDRERRKRHDLEDELAKLKRNFDGLKEELEDYRTVKKDVADLKQETKKLGDEIMPPSSD